MRVTAVIPAYNEEANILDVVSMASKYCDRIIVVDDCSKDKTAQIAEEAGAEVLVHSHNKGAGAATKAGLWQARESDIIVTLDGDGQHKPEEIPRLLSPIINDKADIVIGSRFLKPFKVQKYRKFGIDVITWLYNIGHKQKITDGQSCFRAFSSYAAELIYIEEDDFGFSTEFLIKARLLRFRITEVPISCIYRNYEQDSTLNPLRHGLGVAWKTIKWRVMLWS